MTLYTPAWGPSTPRILESQAGSPCSVLFFPPGPPTPTSVHGAPPRGAVADRARRRRSGRARHCRSRIRPPRRPAGTVVTVRLVINRIGRWSSMPRRRAGSRPRRSAVFTSNEVRRADLAPRGPRGRRAEPDGDGRPGRRRRRAARLQHRDDQLRAGPDARAKQGLVTTGAALESGKARRGSPSTASSSAAPSTVEQPVSLRAAGQLRRRLRAAAQFASSSRRTATAWTSLQTFRYRVVEALRRVGVGLVDPTGAVRPCRRPRRCGRRARTPTPGSGLTPDSDGRHSRAPGGGTVHGEGRPGPGTPPPTARSSLDTHARGASRHARDSSPSTPAGGSLAVGFTLLGARPPGL